MSTLLMKTLGLIIRGESFRDNGGKNIRNCGLDDKKQIRCSESHIKNIVIPFQEYFDVSVILHTYHTQFTDSLTQMYRPHAATQLVIYNKILETQGSMYGKIMTNTNEFDFILIIRFDLLFKINLCNLILHSSFDYNKIGFPHYLSNVKHPIMHHNVNESGNPRLSDMITWIPKSLRGHISGFILNHYGRDQFDIIPREHFNLFYEDIWTDNNTEIQRNPMYEMPSRARSVCDYIDMNYTTYAVLIRNTLYMKHITKHNLLSKNNCLTKRGSATLLFCNGNGVCVLRGYDIPNFDLHALECISLEEAMRKVLLSNILIE